MGGVTRLAASLASPTGPQSALIPLGGEVHSSAARTHAGHAEPTLPADGASSTEWGLTRYGGPFHRTAVMDPPLPARRTRRQRSSATSSVVKVP